MAGPGKRGQRGVFTEQVKRDILIAMENGATKKLAAEYAGIGETTLHTWMASKDPDKREFREQVTRASSRGGVLLLTYIQQQAASDWRAGAWILERRWPEEYGKREAAGTKEDPIIVEHTHTHKHFDLSKFTPEEIANLDALAARYDTDGGEPS